jgi:hypothetical protein
LLPLENTLEREVNAFVDKLKNFRFLVIDRIEMGLIILSLHLVVGSDCCPREFEDTSRSSSVSRYNS